MFRDTRIPIFSIGLLGLIVLASPGYAGASEADLLATLEREDASFFDKTIACKRLGTVGTEAAVPVLAGLLSDEKLSHYARYGLEPIPSPRVDEALFAALSTLEGRHLVGVIHSIANRGKAEAIGRLADKLDDADRVVAKAAAHAIARLGTRKAGEILGRAMSPEFAAACLRCGKTLAMQGHKAQAIDMLAKLSALDDVPEHIRLAALLQTVKLQNGHGLATLASALRSDDQDEFNTGLRTARLLNAADAAQAVLESIEDASPGQTAMLVTLLGDLADPTGLPAVVEAAASDDTSVRIAAFGALASLGNADHVALLMDATTDSSSEVSGQAQKTLASLSGPDVDQAVLELLNDEARQATVIRLIGQRRIAAAVPKLLARLDGPNRLEIVDALGETVALEELDVLGKLIVADSPKLREAARRAMHAACNRMPDRNATAAKLSNYLHDASEETIRFIMDELRRIGGSKALATVAKAARGNDVEMKEYATQALGEWLDTSAAPVLLDLARTEDDGKYGIRGIRGYIRLARQFSMPEEQRIAMCRNALETANRVREKALVLQVLERYPSVQALQIAVDAGKVPALKNDAARTALVVAKKIGGKSADVEALLAQIGQDGVEVEIIKAEYGAGKTMKDVTRALRKHVGDLPLIVLPSTSYNVSFGGDPVPGIPKQLKIKYRINGKAGEVSFRENATILLPIPE